MEELENASLCSLSCNLTQTCPLPGDGDRKCPLAEGRARVSKTENGKGASVGRGLGMNGWRERQRLEKRQTARLYWDCRPSYPFLCCLWALIHG